MITFLPFRCQTWLWLLALLMTLHGVVPQAEAQVFPPRSHTQSVPAQPAPPAMGQPMPGPNQMPPMPGPRQL